MLGFFVPVAQAAVPRLQPLIGTWREVDVSFSFDGAEPPVEVLEAVSRAFGDCWWVELGDESFAYRHWHQGEQVRVPSTVEGTAEARETRANAWRQFAAERVGESAGDRSLVASAWRWAEFGCDSTSRGGAEAKR